MIISRIWNLLIESGPNDFYSPKETDDEPDAAKLSEKKKNVVLKPPAMPSEDDYSAGEPLDEGSPTEDD